LLHDNFETPIHFGQQTTALLIERELLSCPRLERIGTGELITFGDLRRMAMALPPRTTSGKAAHIVSLRVRSGGPEIDSVAEKLEISVRTLQRELNRDGVRFRDLVQRARFDQAVRLVVETPSPIEDIAREIGYSDPANFTRAFRRASGMPPKAYRRLHRGGF
jgi:AraC-like DNA-binding protein